MITLTELMGAMALHMMHERDWTMEEAVAWVKVRIAEAREEYRQAGTPLGDSDEGFITWLAPRHQPPTA
jgi:hypothetical protein